jgi:hypothetical protein
MQKFFSIEIPSYYYRKNELVLDELTIYDEEIQEVLDSGEFETEIDAICELLYEYIDECNQQHVNTILLSEEQLKILKEQILKFSDSL